MNILQIFETFFVSVIASYSLSPMMRSFATSLGYVDHPKDNKVHAHPTPLLGGVAIFAAFIIAVATKVDLISSGYVKAIIGGSMILLLIGLVDDKVGMVPNIKLLGQFLAALIAVKAGIRIEFIHDYHVSVIFTYLWIIGITNSFNLLDNMNGLSAGIAFIAAAFFGILAYMNSQPVVCALSFAVAGSALGFLRHNFPKASIFMGDAGSLIIGYLLSAVSILASWKIDTWKMSLAVPLLILGYPIFDTTLVTVIRLLQGRSVFDGGKDHSSHRLALLGLKRFRTVLVIYCLCLFLGTAGLLMTRARYNIAIFFAAFAFLVMLALGIRLSFVDTKRFGRKKGIHGAAKE